MQLEELRMNKKLDEDDPSLIQDVRNAKQHLLDKQNAMLAELKAAWNQWDALVDRAAAGEAVPDADSTTARDALLAVLNRRNYIRNLLREVDEVLES